MVGIKGVIVKETMRTFVIVQLDEMQEKSEEALKASMIVKAGTVFRVKLPAEEIFQGKPTKEMQDGN